MPELALGDVTVHYEARGESGTPVVLIAGLGGLGRSWGSQIELFARDHRVVAPDHRGTGGSTRATDGYSIEQHAQDVAGLLARLGLAPAHVVGLSTGGAIGQVLALDHPHAVRTLTLASTWARVDAYFRRQFEGRKRILNDSGQRFGVEMNSLFLFSPPFHRAHPERIEAWIEASSAGPPDLGIALARIDMILAHDRLDQLGAIACPVLVVAGTRDFCTPPYFAEEIAGAIPGAQLIMLEAGHFSYAEKPDDFHQHVASFIARHDA
jgi:aminoacrylate hydrolase